MPGASGSVTAHQINRLLVLSPILANNRLISRLRLSALKSWEAWGKFGALFWPIFEAQSSRLAGVGETALLSVRETRQG
jgi:hypothetical protein